MLTPKIVVILLLLLIQWEHIRALICINNSSFTVLHSELLSPNHSIVLSQLHNITMYSSKTSAVCHTTICSDYNLGKGNLSVEFGEDMNHTGNYIGFETWFPLSEENNSIVSCLDYVCSTSDLCDRIFVENWIVWFAKVEQKMIQETLITLLTASKHFGQCDVTKGSANCSSGVCTAEYIANRNHSVVGAGCVEDPYFTYMELYLKMQSVDFRSIKYKELRYDCRANNCNDEPTFKRVWNETARLLKQYKPVVTWLRRQNRFRTARNSSTGRPLTRNERHSSTSPFWFLGVLLLILASIGVAGYYLYLRNRQGYRAATTSA